LQEKQLQFKGAPDGVRVEFTTEPAQAAEFEGRQAFVVTFPEKLYYFQRREYFRVPTPMLNPYTANGVFGEGESFRCEIQDVSLGGIALRTESENFAALDTHTVLGNVELDLGPFGSLDVDLELISPRSFTTPTGMVRYVIGFRFVELTSQAEGVLQRLITKIEAKRRSLAG
jgi:flagellar brake protein